MWSCIFGWHRRLEHAGLVRRCAACGTTWNGWLDSEGKHVVHWQNVGYTEKEEGQDAVRTR